MIKTWFEALKIKHWIKNFFVFVPFLASRKFGVNESLLLASAGVVIFGLMSSAVYLFNDCADIEADRQHPTKRSRPVASGRIPVRVALTVAFVLAAVSMACALKLDLRFSAV
ncbi:MAG TPA: UbiA family prenyltransferase, partial [Thermodesulfobacteriota bacterium]|nr:UbiA family prenyltransferase [Thermodesulfobacteriota bacterium]